MFCKYKSVSLQQQKKEKMNTLIDTRKQNADILIEYANGGSFTIDTKGREISGRGVIERYENGNYEVTTAKLNSLRKVFNIQTNF